MSSAADNALIRPRHAPEPVRVVNWPLRDDRIWGWLMACGCFAVAAFVASVADSVLMGIAALAALCLATWRLWIPVTFEFSSKGVLQTSLGRRRRIPWRQIGRYEFYRHGVLLLADSERSLLSPLRGVFVKYNDQRQAIARILDFYLERGGAASGLSTESYLAK